MRDWAHELLDEMRGVCELLDAGLPDAPYATALAMQAAKVSEVELTPSARLLSEMRTTGESFFQLALRMSEAHKSYFLELHPPNEQRLAEFRNAAEESLRAQAAIEAADTLSFDDYLRRYFAD
jgi:glutamate--cysteine ligase